MTNIEDTASAAMINIEDTAGTAISDDEDIEDTASAASDDEDTASATWVMQEEIHFVLNALMDCIPKLIPPLAQIVKEYTGLKALFVGLSLYCKDITGKLCPATVILIKDYELLVHYDGWSDKWDQWISQKHYDYRLVDWNSAQPPQHNMSVSSKLHIRKHTERKDENQLCSCGHFHCDHSGVDWANWCTISSCDCSNL